MGFSGALPHLLCGPQTQTTLILQEDGAAHWQVDFSLIKGKGLFCHMS